jgi:hypothetical protein
MCSISSHRAHDSLWALGVTNTLGHFFLEFLFPCFSLMTPSISGETCAEHIAGLCRLRSCARTHLALDLACTDCSQLVPLTLLPYPPKVGMYGRVSFHSYHCSICASTRQLAIKVTSHKSPDDIVRNAHEASVWQSVCDIPGIVPLLSHKSLGSCYLFFMPRMLPLLSMRETVLTYSYKRQLISRLHHILTDLFNRGLVYPDGGCKQVLIDPQSKLAYLCDFDAVKPGNFNCQESLESLKLVVWELRVEFKGHAEKLKKLDAAESLAEMGEEISRSANY